MCFSFMKATSNFCCESSSAMKVFDYIGNLSFILKEKTKK